MHSNAILNLSFGANLLEQKAEQAPLPSENKTLHLKLSVTEKNALVKLNNEKDLGLHFPEGNALNLLSLKIELERLILLELTSLKAEKKLLIKKYKLALIQAFENYLEIKLKRSPLLTEQSVDSPIIYYLRRLGFGFLLIFGLLMDGIGSLLGGQELISQIPNISNPIMIVVGIAFSLVNSILYYYFEAVFLKQAMGIEEINEAGAHLEVDEAALERTKNVNLLMQDLASMPLDKFSFEQYAEVASCFNEDLRLKASTYSKEPPEKLSHKIFRHTITVLGAIMTAGNSYFMATSLLSFAAASFLGTPLGWIFIGVGIAAMLSTFLLMRGKAMINMLDPEIQKFKEVKGKFEKFENKEKNDFIKKYEEKPTLAQVPRLKKENFQLKVALLEAKLNKKEELPARVIASHHLFWGTKLEKPNPKQPENLDSTSTAFYSPRS